MFAAPILRQPISQQLHACLRWSPWSGVEVKQVSYNYCCRPSFSSPSTLPVPPSLATSSSLLWRAMRQSLPCSCLHSGPSSSPLTYIFNMRSGAASGLHFGLCGGGNFQSNNDLFCAPQKSSPSFRLVRANDVLFVLAIPFAHSLRIIMRKTEVNSECTASFCLWDRPHFLLLTQF